MSFRSPFFWRLFAAYGATVAVAVVLLALLAAGVVGNRVEREAGRRLAEQAELLSFTLAELAGLSDRDAVESVVGGFAQSTGLHFTAFDVGGNVLADSRENFSASGNQRQRPEVRDAIATGAGTAVRYSQALGEELRYHALPVFREQELTGVVRVALPASRLNAEIRDSRFAVVRPALLAALAGLLVAAGLAWRQTRVIERMTDAAAVIARGEFGRRVPVVDTLGLGRLAEAINQLARNSAERFSEISADRNRLATIFTGMVEGVIDVDENQKILHINEAASRLLNVDAATCQGKPVWEEIRHHEITGALDQAIRTRSVINKQMSLSRSSSESGDAQIVDVYAASLSDDSGQPVGAVAVLHDITELKSLERVRTDFVANASHELKTPITAIRGLSESVVDDDNVDRDTMKSFMSRIHAQSMRLSQLIGDLLTISRLESARGEEEFTPLNLEDLVRRSLKSAEPAVELKRQKLEVALPEEKVEVLGDAQNLSQLLDNLIDNAVKYTPEEGSIRVALELESDAIALSVADSGIGISSQYQQRIFERFYRVDKARSRSLGGTGLGLSIVKNIAERHHGSVAVKSQPGRGATFTFRMPRAAR